MRIRLMTGVLCAVTSAAIFVSMDYARGAEDIKTQIEAANAKFAKAFAAGDAAAAAACYTKDAQVLPTGMDVVSGTAAIEAFWNGSLQNGPVQVTLTTLEAEQHGDTAIEVGRATIADANGTVVDVAKYIVIWKRVDGEWKLHRDIFNSNRPVS